MNTGSLGNLLNCLSLRYFPASGLRRAAAAAAVLFVGLVPVEAFPGVGQSSPASQAIAAQWTFSRQQDGSIIDNVGGDKARLVGNIVKGISPVGDAAQFDGYTGCIITKPISALDSSVGFAVSAWVQLEAYPWNRVPIVDQESSRGDFYFGVDEIGHLVASGSSNEQVQSDLSIPLRKWTLVAVNVENGKASFTINGVRSKALPFPNVSVEGTPNHPSNDLIMGHVRAPLLPGAPRSIHPDLPVEYSIEGSLGELTIYRRPLSADEVRALLAAANPELLKEKPWAPLPRWSGGPGSFGGFYTTLHFDPLWDESRRVSPDSDVVVRFPDSPIQLIFWQGNNYIPAWVTENNRWYTDEFMEIFGHPRCPYGEDCEPMSDKQVRYSHVRILESTPARVVIDWRYALSEVQNYAIGDANSPTVWGDWADEYWTVYPDHVAIRQSVLWSTAAERDKTEFQESIVIIPPGETPEDSLNLDALTFANLDGQTATYSWQAKTAQALALPKGPSAFPKPINLVIQWVNLKSQWKPFEIPWGEPITSDAYNGEPSISSFEWWNHWPVAQIPSSGRPALAADRPGHTSLSHLYWPVYQRTDQSVTKLLMDGLTTVPAADLVSLAKSWRSPAELRMEDSRVIQYDQAQRAYILPADLPPSIRLTLNATKEHPAKHFALVVPGWSDEARLTVLRGAKPIEVQRGIVNSLEGGRLILYVPMEAENEVEFELSR